MIDDVPGQLELCDVPLFPVATTADAIGRAPSVVLPYEDKYFSCIEKDDPWCYKRNKGYNGFDTVQEYRINCPYETMSLEELQELGDEINRVAAPKCHLWQWTTKDFLFDALAMIRDWGWQEKQIITWVKTTDGIPRGAKRLKGFSRQEIDSAERVMQAYGIPGLPLCGMGHWLRNATEFLILAVNDPRQNRPACATTDLNVIFAPRRRHSEKPAEAYDLIRRNSPGPRLSMFQRTARDGFSCWGNQMEAR